MVVFLFLLSLGFAALGGLTVFKSPAWSKWQLALLVGEYGHTVVWVPPVLGFLTWRMRGGFDPMVGSVLALNLLALALLLKPTVQAWFVGRALPARLERAFGAVPLGRPAFSCAAWLRRAPRRVVPQTHGYAAGLALDFYPAVGRTQAPCVVLIHGGGWDSGDKSQLAHFNHWLAQRGYAVAAISYRLAPQFNWPAQRDDILAAIAWLKAHAATLGIDATRLVLLGRSAGGNLAETVGYTAQDPAIRGVAALYAPADLDFAWTSPMDNDPLNSPLLMRQFLGGSPDEVPGAFKSASGIHEVTAATPPTLLLHGRLDTLVWYRQSERLAARLDEAGVSNVFVSLPWATHAFEFNLNGPGGQLTTYALEWFLAAVTK